MHKRLNCVMLVDDNPDDNFFHTRVITKNDFADFVLAKQTGKDALEYLKTKEKHLDKHPDLILLDINMPGMTGWEFLDEYNKLDEYYRSKVIVVMLTTSDNPLDLQKAKQYGIPSEFKTKPLTKEMMEEIISKHF